MAVFTAEGTITFTSGELADQAGSRWFAGAGVPAASRGCDGDFYLDSDTGDVYEKENGTWV